MQRHKDKIRLGLLISVWLFTGCITEYYALLPLTDSQVLAVDGHIVANSEVTFFISESFSLESPNIPNESYVNNAILTIIGSNGYQSSPAINQGKGNYQIQVGELDDDVEYGIEIQYNGDIYRSALSKPLYTPEIDSVMWVQPENYGDIYFHVSTHNDTIGSRFYAWSYTEDWEFCAAIPTRIFFNPISETYSTTDSARDLYCWKKNKSKRFVFGTAESLTENRIINQQLHRYDISSSNNDDRFSLLYCITVYQQTISKEFYEYYQNVKRINEEMGGLFTPQPSEFIGNISCITNPEKKVLGYIHVNKNTTLKRTFVYPEELVIASQAPQCGTISHKLVDPVDFYRMGYRPAGDADPECYPKIIPKGWSAASCTDCTVISTQKKPDFWPNNH